MPRIAAQDFLRNATNQDLGAVHKRYVDDRMSELGQWGTDTLGDCIGQHATDNPGGMAFIETNRSMTWREYDEISDQLAGILVHSGFAPGDRCGFILPDGPLVHAVFVGIEKAGLIAVGIGPRAGVREIKHLLSVSGATALVTVEVHHGRSMPELFAELTADGVPLNKHIIVNEDEPGTVLINGALAPTPDADSLPQILAERHPDVGDIWLLNSTSGTTGLPKCVVHTQNRWRYYHTLCLDAGEFTQDDIFMGLIPAPFGFGIWTCHYTPTVIGCPTVVMSRFTPEGALRLIERERVTVLTCVSTQFIMMLNSEAFDQVDLSSLRCMFTGGEAVPYERSIEFEARTGAKILQFYGSNETGTLSYTRHSDTVEKRLMTAGHVIERMHVRLYDDEGIDVTASGGPGQAGCAGPATCIGYYADTEANDNLFSPDGSMMTGDICVIDDDGYLAIVGRKSDFIIRGGKNISAVAVEEQVRSHPAVAMAAAVAMPDPVFGERVAVYVELRENEHLDLPSLIKHLDERDFSKETWPERLEVVDELPRSSGGKVAKGDLRADIKRRLEAERASS